MRLRTDWCHTLFAVLWLLYSGILYRSCRIWTAVKIIYIIKERFCKSKENSNAPPPYFGIHMLIFEIFEPRKHSTFLLKNEIKIQNFGPFFFCFWKNIRQLVPPKRKIQMHHLCFRSTVVCLFSYLAYHSISYSW